MPYPALPSARRLHYDIDGSIAGWEQGATPSSGMTTVLTTSQLLQLNNEATQISYGQPSGNNRAVVWYVLFPEPVDVSYFLAGVSGQTIISLQGSTNTTSGVDGTWNNITGSGTFSQQTGGDWWRANAPFNCTGNNTNLVGIRFATTQGVSGSNVNNVLVWGHKHSGATPDDILFLESDATTEWPNDDDWGDLDAAGAAVTHTYYVKNAAAIKTANTITVKSSGMDAGQWTVSLDNVSFASSKSISSLAAGATQIVYFKFTPPAATSGNFRPFAAYLEADVTSWT